ncbi:hypothetical protein KI688_004321 [Linnemannia hyalina]|uniref:Uncharacterized protein n=1 Tax=Linnemannia hyalina TaxID=64524 RepID=A0A9P7XMX0_9FUNG|nr:hypothetical protein KI688_004321 [Linnemannia hyalina]
MGLGDPTPKPAAVTLADVAERKAALDAINAKKHDKPPNKDQDKQDSSKSGNSNDRSKNKPKNNNDKGSGNDNNNNNKQQ